VENLRAEGQLRQQAVLSIKQRVSAQCQTLFLVERQGRVATDATDTITARHRPHQPEIGHKGSAGIEHSLPKALYEGVG
jgi:hypothetical protein